MKTGIIKINLILLLIFVMAGCSGGTEKADGEKATMQAAMKTNEHSEKLQESYDLLSGELSLKRIDDTSYVVTHKKPWPSNSLVVKMNNSDILMVDTPYTLEATEVLLDWIRDYFGNGKITAVNTHFHIDRLGGNKALIDRKIPIYGSDLTVKMLRERGEASKNYMIGLLTNPEDDKYKVTLANLSLIPPTEIFKASEGKVLQFGKEKVSLYYPGPGHSLDNLVVFFEDRSILFGGCMIISKEQDKLGSVNDANIEKWPDSVQNVINIFKNTSVVIPGHGSYGDRSLLTHTLDILKKG